MEETFPFNQAVEAEELICLPEFPLEINLTDGEQSEESTDVGKWCLVQQWNSLSCLQHHLVFIKDCDLHLHDLQIFYATSNYEDGFDNWLRLWKHCFQMAYKSNVANLLDHNWFLLQTSTEDEAIVTYEIVEKNQFHMHYNLTMVDHPNYGIIFQMDCRTNTNIHQRKKFVHILRFDINDYKLLPLLQAISLLGSNDSIYNMNQIPKMCIHASDRSENEQLQEDDDEEMQQRQHEQLENTLKILNEREEIMFKECQMFIDIMDKVRKIREHLTETYKTKLNMMNMENANDKF